MRKSFTLIEMLVVVTIIVLLTAAAAVSYSSFLKQSRDARRKTDLEQLRAALEMYRNNTDAYPTIGLSDLTPTYIQTVPTDPKNFSYYYTSSGTDYTLGAHLENNSATCQGLTTQCTSNCTYCLGPYGEIQP